MISSIFLKFKGDDYLAPVLRYDFDFAKHSRLLVPSTFNPSILNFKFRIIVNVESGNRDDVKFIKSIIF